MHRRGRPLVSAGVDGSRDGVETGTSRRGAGSRCSTQGPELRRVPPTIRPAPTEESAHRRKAKPPAKRSKTRARKSRLARGKRALIVRLAYWTLVVALWVAIGGVGVRCLGRRTSAADPVAGNSQAPAVDPDRRRQGPRAGDARRHGRRRDAVEGIAALRAARPSSPSRTGASTSITASIRSASAARADRQRPAPRRRAGRLDASRSSSPKICSSRRSARSRASCRKRCSRSGSSTNSPRRRFSSSISTASTSAPAPMASKRLRNAISASRRAR